MVSYDKKVFLTTRKSAVLILVVVDDGLVRSNLRTIGLVQRVLILVVVDDGLVLLLL